MRTIQRDELKQRLAHEQPDNRDRANGFALVNVLTAEDFLDEHIPGSINIPRGRQIEFERLFDKAKEIIVYCASPECSASTHVADDLVQRGFTNIIEYEGGMSDWKAAGNRLERGESSVFEMRLG